MTPTRAKLLLLSEPSADVAVRSGPRSCEAQYKARLTFKKQIPAPPSISSMLSIPRGVPSGT